MNRENRRDWSKRRRQILNGGNSYGPILITRARRRARKERAAGSTKAAWNPSKNLHATRNVQCGPLPFLGHRCIILLIVGCVGFWQGLQAHDGWNIVGDIGGGVFSILLGLPFLFGLLASFRPGKKERLLREQPNAIFLYDHGLLSHQWRGTGKVNTWKRELHALRWNEIPSLHSETASFAGASTFSFWIKTRGGDWVDLSLGGRGLAASIEQRIGNEGNDR